MYDRNETIPATEITITVRLASSVRKQFIFAIPKGKDKVDFIGLDWWKA